MFFKKKKKFGMEYEEAKTVTNTESSPNTHFNTLVFANDYPNICAMATSVCWDKPIPETLEDRLTYVGKRVKSGHESVIEHSNMVFYIYASADRSEDLFEFVSHADFLHIRPRRVGQAYHILIGGSIRAYKDAISECIYNHMERNYMVISLMELLYRFGFKEYFADLCEYEIMDSKSFTGNSSCFIASNGTKINDKIEIINADVPSTVMMLANSMAKDSDNPGGTFTMDDIYDVCTVTVLFQHMSRTGTHQLVRHRNAITQESQRYVDYSNAHFVNPADFKPDRYSPDDKYSILFGGKRFEYTLKELGDELQRIYPQLLAPYMNKAPALLKEDARSFLPSNVESKLYMTFTWNHLFKFLDLRTAKAAQAEIRSYAISLENYVDKYGYDWNYYALPKFKRRKYKEEAIVDEPVGEVVESVEEKK